MLAPEKKQAIIKRLQEKLATLPCSRCGNTNFGVVEGFFNEVMQEDKTKRSLSGESFPTIAVACMRCGFMSYHSLGVLGLMDLF